MDVNKLTLIGMDYLACCVPGCKAKVNLHRFPLPKDRERQRQWVIASGNKNLLHVAPEKLNAYRICGQHFEAKYIIGKRVTASAVPTLKLPGKLIHVYLIFPINNKLHIDALRTGDSEHCHGEISIREETGMRFFI